MWQASQHRHLRLNPAVKPRVSNIVRALATEQLDTVRRGGSYGAVNGGSRNSLSAVTITTGALLGWKPKVDNGAVWSMVLAPGGTRVMSADRSPP